MFVSKCLNLNRSCNVSSTEPEPFSLPQPLPDWPTGGSFATGRISIGEIEITKISKFQHVWSYHHSDSKTDGASFYKPIDIPSNFFSLGHYGQPNNHPLRGFVFVARDVSHADSSSEEGGTNNTMPALRRPLDYTLVWSTNSWTEENYDGFGGFWLPQPPQGYKAMGFVVTNQPQKPLLEEVACVRADLAETCEQHRLILNLDPVSSGFHFQVWSTRPCNRGMWGKGVSVGTFSCGPHRSSREELCIACLKNADHSFHGMPNMDQIHSLVKHYGPTVFFHPKEIYLPSSVSWFFGNGAKLYHQGQLNGEPIDADGMKLPSGGRNDGEYWIDLPDDDRRGFVKHGNIETAELYIHVKPALGGTFTDIAMWVFCPFNGPATLKIGSMNFSFSKIGQHVGDWEHFTLRVSNLSGELWSIYFSQHSGGEWVEAWNLEYIEGNKAVIYSSKSGHASFPHPGIYLQGSQKLGIGIRNDAMHSSLYIDSSTKYQIVAAEYLGSVVTEPTWLQYMREWGPKIMYSSRKELDKIVNFLPSSIKCSVEKLIKTMPLELSGEEGPTGPKEKNNWLGDERG